MKCARVFSQIGVALDHLKPALNIGKIFCSADAFGAAEVHLISTHFFDPAPAKGEKLPEAHMPAQSAFIFGNEEFGHSFNNDNYSRIKSLKIPQFDRVESLNVSIAASIVMYEYIKQNARGKRRIDLPKAESCLGSCCPQKFLNCLK